MELGIVELAVVAEELGYALAPSPLAATWAAKLLLPGARGPRDGRDVGPGGADRESRHAGRRATRSSSAPTGDRVVTPGRRTSRSRRATIEPARALDPTRPLFTVRAEGGGEELTRRRLRPRWHAVAVMAAAESVGVAARVTQMTVEYAKERKQFGRPIGSYQAVSHACAQMFLETEGARNVVLLGGVGARPRPRGGVSWPTHCAKAYASDAAVNVCRSSLQVHGGIGFTWEHDLHLFLKRAEANAHAYGDAGWHREQVAARCCSCAVSR